MGRLFRITMAVLSVGAAVAAAQWMLNVKEVFGTVAALPVLMVVGGFIFLAIFFAWMKPLS